MKEENGSHIADAGKVFKRIIDGVILSGKISLGKHDSILNYIEVDKPEPIEEEEI